MKLKNTCALLTEARRLMHLADELDETNKRQANVLRVKAAELWWELDTCVTSGGLLPREWATPFKQFLDNNLILCNSWYFTGVIFLRGAFMKSYHPDDPKLMANWFDVHNPKHLRAWRELHEIGHWPAWFQDLRTEESIETHLHWSSVIESKLANAWVNHQLGTPH